MRFKDLHEKATSIAQQKLMALALQHKRGELDADKVTPAVEKLAKSMSEKELDDFASTKHKGLPQKKEDSEVSNRSAALKPQMYNDPVTGKKKVRMVPTKSNIVKINDPDPEDVKESVNEVGFQGTAATALRVGALGAVGGAAYAAKKARDRFDPVKVAAARRKKDERQAEIEKAKDELNQRKQYRQKLRDMQRKQRERQASK